MIKEDEILSSESLSFEAERLEFSRIRKLYFENFISGNRSAAEKILEMKHFFSNFENPLNYEPFIDEADIPLLWSWDNPYIIAFENELKEKLSLFRSKHIDLKKHFSKIFLEEDKNKKEINLKLFLGLTKSFFGINHILIPLLKSIVFLYNKSSINYDLALKELNDSENMLVYLDPSKSCKKVFTYLINLYKAYAYNKIGSYNEAEERINICLYSNPNGINIHFFRCNFYTKLNQFDKVEDSLNKIVSLDLEKIKNALDKNNLNQFYYSLQNPTLPNIFNFNNLASINEIINKVLSTNFDKKITFDNLEKRISAINEINLVEYLDDTFIEKIIFLNHIFSDKNNINTVFFKLIIPIVEEKFLNLVENLKENVKKNYYAELYSKLNDYDKRIRELNNKKNELSEELIKLKEQAEKKMQESIKLFDESISNAIAESEQLLSNVDLESKLNPFEALQNSMIYNFISSIFVFLLAIFANYINIDNNLSGKVYSVMSYLIIEGIKWAAITFLIGIVISLAYAIFVFIEKTNFQQNLKRKIAQLKKEKEFNIDLIRKDFNKKISALTEENNSKRELYEKRIEELRKEKLETENSLKAKAEQNMQPIMDKINLALNPTLNNSTPSE